jgi:hypothetical protein
VAIDKNEGGVKDKRIPSVVSPQEKNRLLKKYWTIPERQIETSVVLTDGKCGPRLAPSATSAATAGTFMPNRHTIIIRK